MNDPRIYIYIYIYECRHAGHCWRSRDELIRDVLLWTPTHGRAKAGRPARTYIQQLCEDTGCCPEDLPRAMIDREEWRERVRDIRATSAIWWWWYCYERTTEILSIYVTFSFLFSVKNWQYIDIILQRTKCSCIHFWTNAPGESVNICTIISTPAKD